MKLLILAVCVAVASALPALLGSDHCTYGPSYWCSHIKHARECGTMRHCMSTAWKYNSQPVKTDSKCEVCVNGVTEARKRLKEQATQKEISEFLGKACEMMPGQKLRDDCLAITEEYLPEILQLLASDVDPKMVCSVIGMCTQDLAEPMSNDVETKTEGPSDLCKDCQKFSEELKKMLKDNATEGQIEATLAVLCKQLGPLENECKALIAQYVPVLLDMLSTEFDSKDVCRIIRMCTQDLIEQRSSDVETTMKAPSALCNDCQKFLEDVEKMLKDNATEGQLEASLDMLCKQLGVLQNECKALIAQYVPVLLDLLSTEFDPKDVCRIIRMCTQDLTEQMSNDVESTTKAPTALCNDCQKFLQDVEKMLKDNATEGQIVATLDVLCQQLGPLENECKALIAQYAPVLLNLLATEFNPSSVCRMLGLCQSGNVKNAMEFRVELLSLIKQLSMSNDVETTIKGPSDLCEDCQKFFEDVEKMLKDNATEGQIVATLDVLCQQLGPLEKECKALIAQYVPVLLDLLSTEFKPAVVCQMLAQCQSGNVKDARQFRVKLPMLIKSLSKMNEMRSPVRCEICTEVMKELELMDRGAKTQAEVTAALLAGCSRLPKTVTADCESFVDQYASAVRELLVNDLDPARVCQALGLCSRPIFSSAGYMEVTNSVSCEVCQLTMGYVEAMLKTNPTEAEIREAVEKVCSYIPPSMKKQCDDFVNQYLNTLVKVIAYGISPDQVCKEIGLCGSETVAHPAVKQLNSLLQQAKTDNTLYYMDSGVLVECVQGPDVWCKDQSTAEKCGAHAVAYCRRHIWTR